MLGREAAATLPHARSWGARACWQTASPSVLRPPCCSKRALRLFPSPWHRVWEQLWFLHALLQFCKMCLVGWHLLLKHAPSWHAKRKNQILTSRILGSVDFTTCLTGMSPPALARCFAWSCMRAGSCQVSAKSRQIEQNVFDHFSLFIKGRSCSYYTLIRLLQACRSTCPATVCDSPSAAQPARPVHAPIHGDRWR